MTLGSRKGIQTPLQKWTELINSIFLYPGFWDTLRSSTCQFLNLYEFDIKSDEL